MYVMWDVKIFTQFKINKNMQNNQFFYTRIETIDGGVDAPSGTIQYRDSFNINKIIRSVELSEGKLLILLDDIHNRTTTIPDFNRQGKVVGTKKDTSTYQTEITLSEKEDIERFYKLTAI